MLHHDLIPSLLFKLNENRHCCGSRGAIQLGRTRGLKRQREKFLIKHILKVNISRYH